MESYKRRLADAERYNAEQQHAIDAAHAETERARLLALQLAIDAADAERENILLRQLQEDKDAAAAAELVKKKTLVKPQPKPKPKVVNNDDVLKEAREIAAREMEARIAKREDELLHKRSRSGK